MLFGPMKIWNQNLLNVLTNTRKFVKNKRIWTHFPREPVTSPILNTFNDLFFIYIPEMRNTRLVYIMKYLSSLVYLKLNSENVNLKNMYLQFQYFVPETISTK